MSLLDEKDNDIYLLLDKKSRINNDLKQRLNNSVKNTALYFTNSVDIRWGGFSQIAAEMELFKTASKNNYQYYHLLSGVDLPLVSNEKIHNFFDSHENKCFLSLVDDKISKQNKVNERIKYYHIFNERMLRGNTNKILGKILFKLDKVLVKIQKLCKINLIKKNKIKKVGYASNWVSLDNETVQLLVANEAWVYKVFKKSFCADELFIPTFMYQFGLDNKIYSKKVLHDKPNDVQGNLRYINWWDGSPYTWKDGDEGKLDYAISLGHFWSRKFDLSTSSNLKNYILSNVEK